MNRRVLQIARVYAGLVLALISSGMMWSCARRAPEHVRSEAIIKAMHDNLFIAHDVADSLVKERDGIDLLAERLAKNPAAAGQLMDAMLRKGGVEKVFAERCAALSARPPDAGPPTQQPPKGGSQ